jgi:hypothetical protein
MPRMQTRGLMLERVLSHVHESAEQASGIKVLKVVGAAVYALGNHRKRGDHQGTMQTPGISDVIAILPRLAGVVFWEAKARRGRMSPEQAALRIIIGQYERAGMPVLHCLGGYDQLCAVLRRRGLLTRDQIPAHHLTEEGESVIREDARTPMEIQAEAELIGKQQRAKHRAGRREVGR